jgi:hypothetical protein
MKKIIFYLLLTLFISLISCNLESDKIYGELISHSSCKNDKGFNTNSDKSCIIYEYNIDNEVLTLKHINASYNCCPDHLYSDITIENNTITIVESEKEAGCNCMCLFDLEIAIYNIESNTYLIKYVEPYIGSQEKIEFEINLDTSTSGTHCVDRTQYPWGL